MKTLSHQTFTLLPFLWFSLSPISASGSSSRRAAIYYAPRRTQAIVIDGDLSDWVGIPATVMDSEKFLFHGQGMSATNWNGPKDLSASFNVVWDDEFIYIAVHVTDDHVTEPHGSYVKTNDTGSWDDDGIEIMLDNDGCQMSRYYVGDLMHHEYHFVYSARAPFVFDNFWKRQPGAPQPMFIDPDGKKEPLAYLDEVMEKHDITRIFSQPPYNGTFAFKKTEDGYNLEVRMSLPGTQMKPADRSGHFVGFDIAINDNDRGTGPLKQQLHWSGVNGMFWRNTAEFGKLIFVQASGSFKKRP